MKRTITTWVLAALLILGLSISVDAQVVEQTCNDIFGTNQTASVTGEWGSITFDDTSDTLGVVVLEGWEVRICVKAGSAQQGDGPEDQGWLGEGTYSLTHSSGKELSHFSFDVREVPDDTTTTTTTTLATTTTVVVNPICIDCNNATLADLMQLQGVNATLAQAIIDNRPYERLTDLVSKGVLTGPQLLLILVVNANTGAFASDDCLSFAGTTTTTAPLTTTTLPEGSTTTAPGGPTTTGPVGSTSLGTAPRTPSPEDTLPFTGPEDDLGPIALALSTLGTLVLLGARTLRRDDD